MIYFTYKMYNHCLSIINVRSLFNFALSVSLDSVLQDVRSLERGMEGTKKEFLVQDDIPALKEFVKANSDKLDSLVKDGKTAQVRPQDHACTHEHK